MFSIEGYIDGDLVFRRNTPSRRGVDTLINEGLSSLMAAGAAARDYIEVLQYYPDEQDPEVLSVIFVSDGYVDILDDTEDYVEVSEKILTRESETTVFRSPLDDISDEIL
tara:strand:+ start:687 stop:1016 length:330 start_codon:yes stop_codon:yes gene_type:complete